jgi:hypothetical protein
LRQVDCSCGCLARTEHKQYVSNHTHGLNEMTEQLVAFHNAQSASDSTASLVQHMLCVLVRCPAAPDLLKQLASSNRNATVEPLPYVLLISGSM